MRRGSTERGHADIGSVLFLFPAAVLVMMLLGAVVVDVALAQTRGRELAGIAGTAANDALAALDVEALRAGDGIVLDAAVVLGHVERTVERGPLPEATVDAVRVDVDSSGRTVIEVTLRLEVDLLMAPAVGSFDRITLVRTERAVLLGSEAF